MFSTFAVFVGPVIILAGKPVPQAVEQKLGPATMPVKNVVQAQVRHEADEKTKRHRLADVRHAKQQGQPDQGKLPGMQEHKDVFKDFKFKSHEKTMQLQMAPVIV